MGDTVARLLLLELQPPYFALGPPSLSLPALLRSLPEPLRAPLSAKLALLVQSPLDHILNWITNLDKHIDPHLNPRFAPNSPIGLFLRQTRLALDRLSFDEIMEWWSSSLLWLNPAPSPRAPAPKLIASILNRDYSLASTTLKNHYDQPTVAHSFSTPQYALLMTAYRELVTGGYKTAQQALGEALVVARRARDLACLNLCNSLQLRLSFVAGTNESRLDQMKIFNVALKDDDAAAGKGLASAYEQGRKGGEGGADETGRRWGPMDLLFLVRWSLFDPHVDLVDLFPVLYRAKKLHNTALAAPEPTMPTPEFGAMYEFLMGRVWDGLGEMQVAGVREGCALEMLEGNFWEGGRDVIWWEIRLALLSTQVNRLVERNRKDDALKLMFSIVETSNKRDGMGLDALYIWEGIVWDILHYRGVFPSIQSYILSRRPPRPHVPSTLPQSLGDFLKLARTSAPDESLSHYLKLSHLASTTHREYYILAALLGIITSRIHSVGLGPPGRREILRGSKELEDHWNRFSRLDAGVGGELLGRAWLLRGRIGIALALTLEGGDQEGMENAMRHLACAKEVFTPLEWPDLLKEALTGLVRGFDHLSLLPLSPEEKVGFETQRDRAFSALRQLETTEQREEEAWIRVRDVEEVLRGVERAVLSEI